MGADRTVQAGTTASTIMGMFTPDMLPVLSGLGSGFAVCPGRDRRRGGQRAGIQ